MTIMEYIASGFMAMGLIFFLGTVVGLIRLPDFYTRLHAASKGDTLSTLFILGGIIIYLLQDPTLANVLASIKLMFIIAILFVGSSTAAHVLTRAAYRAGAKPWTREDMEEQQ